MFCWFLDCWDSLHRLSMQLSRCGGRCDLLTGDARRMPAEFTPPVSLLKPLHGSEPELERRLESFFEQDYPMFEILFCARSDQDPGLSIAMRVAARYPHIPTKFLTCGEPPYANAKVWSLERMQGAAKHQIFVVSDSDVLVTPDYRVRWWRRLPTTG